MLIKFVKPDPRAGSVARMDSHRGQELVDSGAAVKVKEDGAEAQADEAEASAEPVAEKAAPAAKTGKAKK